MQLMDDVNNRLKAKITERQLAHIDLLYDLLELDKDDFCKIVDAVGVEKLIAKEPVYEKLYLAKAEMIVRERDAIAKKLHELDVQRAEVEEYIAEYREIRWSECELEGGLRL